MTILKSAFLCLACVMLSSCAGGHVADLFLSAQTIPVAVLRIRRTSRVAKPRMRIRGVIDHKIDDDPHAALPAAMGEFDKVAQAAVARIDAIIVRDVVAVVLAGRRLERHQPDRGDAEALQIIQPAQQPLEITDAVAIGVHIGADGETIENAVLVPKVVDHAEAALVGPPPVLSGRIIKR